MSETNITSDSDALSPARYAAIFAAWLVPGLGHLLLKRRGRAAVIFLCVGGLAVAGYAMRGQVYSMRGGDMFESMGYLAEIGSGAFYFLARLFEPHGADTALVAGVYGTRFLAIAGLLNFLCVLDAWGIARPENG
ncbi:MAG TPA: DUF6677 family protein [Candidatus Acidoferrales bacterium]|nr:DUF6677 family protein [Candidatus Acidoferrales bacterium]